MKKIQILVIGFCLSVSVPLISFASSSSSTGNLYSTCTTTSDCTASSQLTCSQGTCLYVNGTVCPITQKDSPSACKSGSTCKPLGKNYPSLGKCESK